MTPGPAVPDRHDDYIIIFIFREAGFLETAVPFISSDILPLTFYRFYAKLRGRPYFALCGKFGIGFVPSFLNTENRTEAIMRNIDEKIEKKR